jgi:predicted chitinase
MIEQMQSQSGTPTTAKPLVAIDEDVLQGVIDSVMRLVPEVDQDYAQTGVPALVRVCADEFMTNASQVAYVLATAHHECGFGTPRLDRSESLVEDSNAMTQGSEGGWEATVHTNRQKIEADGQEELERLYWDSAYGNELGNAINTTDGRDYRGRGYVQLTGRANYEKLSDVLNDSSYSYTYDGVTCGGKEIPEIDLLSHPEHVNKVPELAARITVLGMSDGLFTYTGGAGRLHQRGRGGLRQRT